MLKSVCRVKRFSFGGKYFAEYEEVETEMRKWLSQKISMTRVSTRW
jgi:hypothetical protein